MFLDEIYVIHHTHTDVGFTNAQPIFWELQYRFIDEALRQRNRELALLNRIVAEATSTLEPRQALKTALRELAQGRSVALISHRLSSVRIADAIYVIREGAVVERGLRGAGTSACSVNASTAACLVLQ